MKIGPRRSEVRPETVISNSLPGDAAAGGPQATPKQRGYGFVVPRLFCTLQSPGDFQKLLMPGSHCQSLIQVVEVRSRRGIFKRPSGGSKMLTNLGTVGVSLGLAF